MRRGVVGGGVEWNWAELSGVEAGEVWLHVIPIVRANVSVVDMEAACVLGEHSEVYLGKSFQHQCGVPRGRQTLARHAAAFRVECAADRQHRAEAEGGSR